MTHFLKNDKFHTFSIKKYHISLLKSEDMTKRILLLTYFRLASLKYRTEEEIVKVTESLYDFNFNVKADQQGKYHIIYFQGNAIHPKYVDSKEYSIQKVFEAFTDLSTPFVTESGLDRKTFQKAKKLLKANLEAEMKYNEGIATEHAIRYFFKGCLRDYAPRGDLHELASITIEDLYEYYLKFQKEDSGVYVLGDLDENQIPEYPYSLREYPDQNFKDRRIHTNIYYHEAKKTSQCYLRVIYDTQIFTGDRRLTALSLFNYALGASSYSTLFRIIREQYGLCYAIDSDVYGASGILLISAEIQYKDLNLVLEKIDLSIKSVLDTIDLEAVKRLFLITHKAAYDQQATFFTESFRKDCFGYIGDAREVECIESVTMDDIQEITKVLSKPALIYTYGGKNER